MQRSSSRGSFSSQKPDCRSCGSTPASRGRTGRDQSARSKCKDKAEVVMARRQPAISVTFAESRLSYEKPLTAFTNGGYLPFLCPCPRRSNIGSTSSRLRLHPVSSLQFGVPRSMSCSPSRLGVVAPSSTCTMVARHLLAGVAGVSRGARRTTSRLSSRGSSICSGRARRGYAQSRSDRSSVWSRRSCRGLSRRRSMPVDSDGLARSVRRPTSSRARPFPRPECSDPAKAPKPAGRPPKKAGRKAGKRGAAAAPRSERRTSAQAEPFPHGKRWRTRVCRGKGTGPMPRAKPFRVSLSRSSSATAESSAPSKSSSESSPPKACFVSSRCAATT